MNRAEWYKRGQLLLDRHRPEQAEQVLRQGLAEQPRQVFAHILLALALYRQNRMAEARTAAHGALALDPAASEAYYLLSLIENQLEQPTASYAALAEALRLQPFNTKYLAVQAQFLLHQERWAEAQAAAERGLAHNPLHADSLVARAKALCQQKRWAELDQALHRLLAAHPNLTTAHLLRGQEALRQKQYPEARAYIQEALRLDPLNQEAKLLLTASEAKQTLAKPSTLEAPFLNPLPWWGWLAFLALLALSGGALLESADQSEEYFLWYSGGMWAVAALILTGQYGKKLLRQRPLTILLLGMAGVAFCAGYSLVVWHKTYAPDLLRLIPLTVMLSLHRIWGQKQKPLSATTAH
ncbi:tetratricopeptide repeat protein [Hymenobacter cellulosilyticus]|uniref:Tetratricopeptide repeat protein n=1 Tax=Hymenobacter cellulosilyticus TaxID=2932248 RepID=A0A8T9QDT9_9BACT|nr:tetratricopeptide repeat protein [Hymenobacter cellulosilyticus]UOQ74308.1 tetratricopeptide repeat protein [Hymenobacter cellulosilyticus]